MFRFRSVPKQTSRINYGFYRKFQNTIGLRFSSQEIPKISLSSLSEKDVKEINLFTGKVKLYEDKKKRLDNNETSSTCLSFFASLGISMYYISLNTHPSPLGAACLFMVPFGLNIARIVYFSYKYNNIINKTKTKFISDVLITAINNDVLIAAINNNEYKKLVLF